MSDHIGDTNKMIGAGFYRDTKPGTYGRSEWLDLLMAVQDGRATCMRGLEIIEREMDLLCNPPKHVYWGAGEPDCPKDIKAKNGELHTLKCKVCGLENPRDSACRPEQHGRPKFVTLVEEVAGGMGPDYAEIYLTSGQVIQVNDEGFLVWRSKDAYIGAKSGDVIFSGTWRAKP